jgi:type I restriction enzyme M protein
MEDTTVAEAGFGSVIKELRTRLGISQERLASQLRVSFPTVNRWEKGKTQPDGAVRHLIGEFVKSLGPKFEDLHAQLTDEKQKQAPTPLPVANAPARRPRGKKMTATENSGSQLMDNRSMETLLWKAACSIRGEKDAPKFKDYILPLVFIKRLSDVFEDEIARLTEEFGDKETAHTVLEADPTLVRFYIPPEATWPVVSGRKTFDWPEDRMPKTLGEQLTSTIRAIAKANPTLQGVIDIVDYNETRNGEREISDEALARLIETLSDPRYRLGLKDVEPDFLGRAYEYLLRKFAEGQGQSAGEFFTPKEVGWLIARLMNPKQGEEVYDPCCGSGGLLIKCQLVLKERDQKIDRPLKLHGQELTGSSFAIARMNMVLHDMAGEIVRGNTMTNPKFLDDSRLKGFDIVVTNPMWNQDNFDSKSYENDPYERFETRGGYAPGSTADWAWLQHVAASLNDHGRAAVVIDTGAASRGSGSQGENKEKSIRRWFVGQDLIEGVILLPDNLFYNTTAAGIIFVLNAAKLSNRRDQILLVNASGEFKKGRPKNELTEEGLRNIVSCFREWVDREGLCRVVDRTTITDTDYNLAPSRFVRSALAVQNGDIQEILDELAALRKEGQMLDTGLAETFAALGFRWELQR